jgi:hypothetical protein
VNERGEKRFLAIEDGVRESTQSWREVLLGLKRRGLKMPKLAIGDGALGFWAAVEEIFPKTRGQRCWVHKTANVLNYLPKRLQPKAKEGLHAIWMAETRDAAHAAFDNFVETYEAKYPKATACLVKDREELLAYYDFPAQHWQSLRTTNPIESTFATVRHRTKRAKGCLSRSTMLHMMFKLGQCAEKNASRTHHEPIRSARRSRPPEASLWCCSGPRPLHRRPPRPRRNRPALPQLPQVPQDPLDHGRIFDRRDHLHRPTASTATRDLDPEHPLQPLRPTYRLAFDDRGHGVLRPTIRDAARPRPATATTAT